ncbi:DEKNAAC102474 [Brettanomyces naardenensis]|uniref:tRNA (guanine(9)-N1)-methyltransferase n=1 Tax=Brettanomyces naardenensis TaxID=13370 RepID=A0A448YKT2_BRENA|nr:DEKNAAC102474 [Brettanomyces naardenensis]
MVEEKVVNEKDGEEVEVEKKIKHLGPFERPKIPDGMSKHQWKKMVKRQRWVENKGKMKESRRERKKERNEERKRKIEDLKSKGEDYTELLRHKKPRIEVEDQVSTGAKVIIDCAFDDLMLEKEVVSLSSQITRSYSENKGGHNRVELLVTSFDKRLKERFDNSLRDYDKWNEKQIQFVEDDLDKVLEGEDLSKVIYLSADTDEKLEELKSGETYIVGGIVDKGRHKNLCKEKAERLGIQTKRLPIDECIKISGRKVLATSHVVELLIKWFKYRDWKEAFEDVLPPRKLRTEK